MSIGRRVRASFVAGLLLVAPLAVTVFVVQFVFVRLTRALRPVVRTTDLMRYTANSELVAQLVAAVLVAALITLLGYLASRSVGRRLFGSIERGVRLVPLVRVVYFGVRQVGESLVHRSEDYESVVLVEHPRDGLYSVGFVTNRSPGAARAAVDENLYSVFLPNSPNPTAGALRLVPEDQLYEMDLGVRKALRLLVTTGLSADDAEAAADTDVPDAVGEASGGE
jgi:uncharacterized membrane protein